MNRPKQANSSSPPMALLFIDEEETTGSAANGTEDPLPLFLSLTEVDDWDLVVGSGGVWTLTVRTSVVGVTIILLEFDSDSSSFA
jgi:hypothetical protein